MAKIKAKVLALTAEDVPAIAGIVRQADLDEIEEALGIPMIDALSQCVTGSCKAQKIMVQGKIVAVFGDAIHDILGGIGVPWLISTVHVEQYPRQFLHVCKPQVRDMLNRHKHLVNMVDARNTSAIKWLKWLGFDFSEQAVPYGHKGFPFFRFTMQRGA